MGRLDCPPGDRFCELCREIELDGITYDKMSGEWRRLANSPHTTPMMLAEFASKVMAQGSRPAEASMSWYAAWRAMFHGLWEAILEAREAQKQGSGGVRVAGRLF